MSQATVPSTDAPRRRGRPLLGVAVKAVAASVSVILLLTIGYAWFNYTALHNNEHVIELTGLGPPTPTSTGSGAGSSTHVDGAAQNILVVGDDSRTGLTAAQRKQYKVGDDASTSTDTLMVVHVPADGSRATLISIPRDTYVDIPGFNKNKINAAYIDGYNSLSAAATAKARQKAGANELLATVKLLTGTNIDHYVQVGFAGFVDIVKAIGNIPVTLCHAVDDTLAYNRAHQESGGSGFKMSAGKHDLTPVQTLEFVRQRHNLPGVGDDLGREQRQRYFLSAAFARILSGRVLFNPVRLHDLIKAIDNSFTVSSGWSIEAFAGQMSDLSAGKITGQSIPTTNGPLIPGVGSVLVADPAAVQKFVQRLFDGAPATTAPSPSMSSSPSRSTTGSASSTTAPAVHTSCIN